LYTNRGFSCLFFLIFNPDPTQKMKKILALAALFCLSLLSPAQTATWNLVLSSMVEKDDRGLGGATIELLQGATVVKKGVSAGNGYFSMDVPGNGDYILRVSYQDCNSKIFSINTRNVPEDVISRDNSRPTMKIDGVTMKKPLYSINYAALKLPMAKILYVPDEGKFGHDENHTDKMLDALDQIREAERILLEKHANAIKDGDAALKKNDCPLAKKNYEKAIALIPEAPYDEQPKIKLAGADKCIAEKDNAAADKMQKEKEAAEKAATAKLAADKAAKEKEAADRLAKEKAEKDAAAQKLAAEKAAKEKEQADKLAKEKEVAEKSAKEKTEKDNADKAAKAKAEADELAETKAREEEKKRADSEKLAKEKAAADIKAKQEAELAAKEKAASEQKTKTENDKLAKEQAEAAKKKAGEASAAEKSAAELKQNALSAEKEKLAADNAAKAEAEKKNKAQQAAEKAASDKLAAEKKKAAEEEQKKKALAAKEKAQAAKKVATEKELAKTNKRGEQTAAQETSTLTREEAAAGKRPLIKAKGGATRDEEAELERKKAKGDKYSAPRVIGSKEKYRESIKLADDYFKMRRWDEARVAYEEALTYKKQDPYAARKIAEIEKIQK
jgi:hypothetical protein